MSIKLEEEYRPKAGWLSKSLRRCRFKPLLRPSGTLCGPLVYVDLNPLSSVSDEWHSLWFAFRESVEGARSSGTNGYVHLHDLSSLIRLLSIIASGQLSSS